MGRESHHHKSDDGADGTSRRRRRRHTPKMRVRRRGPAVEYVLVRRRSFDHTTLMMSGCV